MIRQYTKTWHNVEQMKASSEWMHERTTVYSDEGIEWITKYADKNVSECRRGQMMTYAEENVERMKAH